MQNAYRRTSLLLLAGLLFVTQSAMAGDNDRGVAQETLMKIEIIVEGETATATLFDTPTGRDFASLLPLSLTLEDYAILSVSATCRAGFPRCRHRTA
jgi:hypothetical protein